MIQFYVLQHCKQTIIYTRSAARVNRFQVVILGINVSMRSIFIFAVILSLFVACRSSKHTYQPAPEVVEALPKMVFLSFRIHRDSAGGGITLIQKKPVDGKIKGEPKNTKSPDHLVISIVGKNHLVLVTEKIPHPLFRDVETTNSKGEFEHKTVTLKEAEFFVRMRLPEGSDWVLVEEFVGNKRIGSAEYPLK
jgi:hypothetical protein